MPKYFIKRGNEVKGPLEKSQLRELFKSGKVRGTDQVRAGQSGEWDSLQNFLAKPQRKAKGKARKSASSPILLIAGGVISIVVLIAAGIYFRGLLQSSEKTPDIAEFTSTKNPSDFVEKEKVETPATTSPHITDLNGGATSTKDLLSLVNVEDWSIVGTWAKEGESLVSPGGNGVRMQIPYSPPEEYELICQIEPLETTRGIIFGLISSGHPFHAILDYRGQHGLEQVGGEDVSGNATRSDNPSGLTVGKKSTIRCVVTKSSVLVNVDDNTIIDWKGSSEELSRNGYWEIPFNNALWFGGFSRYRIHSAKLKEITGQGITLLDQLPPKIVSKSTMAKAMEIYGPALSELAKVIGTEKRPLESKLTYTGKTVLKFNHEVIPKLTPEIMNLITQLKGPVSLELYRMTVPDEASTVEHFAALGKMPGLIELGLWNRHFVDGPRMQALAGSKSIETMVLDHQSMSDDEITALCELQSLVKLRMYHVDLDDTKLYSIATKLPQLEYLTIGHWSEDKTISEKSLAALSQLSNLKFLDICDCQALTDDAVDHLVKLNQLETLNLKNTSVSFSGAKTLRTQLADTLIEWELPPVVIKADQSVPIMEMIKQYPQDKSFFEQQLQRAQREINTRANSDRVGLIVVGRIELEEGDNPAAINAQVVLSNNGFFASAIRDANRPMGFQAQQYRPLDLVVAEHAELNDDGIYDAGVVQMVKAPPEQHGSIVGQIQLEGRGTTEGTRVSLGYSTSNINSIHGGTQGSGGHSFSLSAKTQDDGTFSFKELSEGSYYVYFSNDDFVSTLRKLQVRPGEATDLGTIALDKKREIEIEYVVELNPVQKFDLNQKKTVKVKTGEPFKSREQIYGHDLLFETKSQKMGFRTSYVPCSMMHLGEGLLSDYQDVDISNFQGTRPSRIEPQVGHVYLLNQGHWKHHVLFRINSFNETDSQE